MKHHILLLIFLSLCSMASAQTNYDEEHEEESFSLNTTLNSNISYHYTASDRIDLNPGFSYAPARGKSALFEIDPMMVVPPSAGITGGPNPTVNNGVVGAIGGTVNVSALGGAVYSIPIEVLPGKDGMQPTLSVTYNSQAGNGLLGYGWNLSGLSSITRCDKTIYHDNDIPNNHIDFSIGDGINYNEDRFMLDGQRLLSISNNKTYGQDGCEYRTEVDNIAKIVSYDGDGQNPDKIKVWTKDGLIIEYGFTDNSKFKNPTNNKVAMWMVNKISDYNGNYMTYHYHPTNNSCRIDYIEYTGCSNVQPMYKVTFNYVDRNDKEYYYLYNQKIASSVLLSSISIEYQNEEVYKYTFTYDDINPTNGCFYSRLMSVGLEQSGINLNPTLIEWGDYDSQYSSTINTNNDEFKDVCYVGDFNGDGIDDIATFPFINGGDTYWSYLYGNGHGHFTYGGSKYNKINVENVGFRNIIRVEPCDINGDGLCDLVAICRDSGNGFNYNVYIYYYQANTNGSGFGEPKFIGTYQTTIERIHDCVLFGDYLGNGQADVLVLTGRNQNGNTNGTFLTLGTHDHNDNDFADPVLYQKNVSRKSNKVVQGDFNGDGRTDLMLIDDNGATIYTLKKNQNDYDWDVITLYSDSNPGFPNKYHTCFTGDFNGDGKTDLLTYAKDGSPKWCVSISNTTGFFDQWGVSDSMQFSSVEPPSEGISLSNYGNNEASYSVQISDMDGDGKSDIMFIFEDGFRIYHSPVCCDAWETTHCSFIRQEKVFNPEGCAYPLGQNYIINNNVGKFTHDNVCSLMLRYDPRHPNLYLVKSMDNQHKQNYVKTITDGLGNAVSFIYDYFTNPDFYTISSGNRFININDRVRKQMIPLKALRSITAENVSGTSDTTQYSYEDLYYHMTGRGIIGFKKTTVNNITEGIKTVNINRYAGSNRIALPFLVPSSSTTYIVNGNTETIINEIESSNVLMSGICIIQQKPPVSIQNNSTEIKTYDIHGNPISKEMVEYTYDNNGDYYRYNNVTYIKKGFTTNLNISSIAFCPFREYVDITYYDTPTDKWLVSRVKKQTVTYLQDGENNKTNSVFYQYNNNHPNLLDYEQVNPGDSSNSKLALKTEYSYTFSGNNISGISKVIRAFNDATLQQRRSTKEYSSQYQYRFATTITNSLDYTATAEYDPKFGWKLSDTDCNGLTTNYTRDFFGLDFENISPDGIITHTSKRWSRNHAHAPNSATYYTWTQSSGSYPTMTFYHKTGVPLRYVSHGIDGQTIYVDMTYDDKGNLHTESLPYEAGNSPEGFITYSYDRLNRVVLTEYPDGTSDEVVYNGNEIYYIHHDSGNRSSQTITKKYHPNGWLEQTTDSGGNTVKYEYNSDGTLKSSYVDGSNSAVTLTYNAAGMRDTICDPDYGCMSYIYNAFGEIISQKTPKGVVTEYEYDAWGRMVQRKMKVPREPDEITVWKYSSESGHIGTLERILFNSSTQTITYQYDNLQRVIQTNETYGNTTYSTLYTYNQLGRLNTETYPTGFQVKNKYNSGGYLIAVKDSDDNTLWHADEHDIYGHLTEFHTGNGLTTYRDYNSENGRLLGIITSDGRNLLQNYAYTYDDFGNFASRKRFGSPMLQENFTYDNFNRLTAINTNGTTYRMAYDRYGRMESKSQHDFSFDNARFSNDHPHAVTRVQANRQPPFAGHSVTYTPFDKVQTVTMGNDNLIIEYGYDRQRIRMTEIVNGNQRVKTYVGNCEFIQPSTGDNYSFTYLCSPDGIFAVAESTSSGFRLHYVHTDNLGSWDIITDMGGDLEQSLSFDAWGNRRNASTWNGSATDTPLFDRGFTGHEHLYNFGLINMNGRVYDPFMSTFLSPDNYIQAPDNSQNFNRYAYCLNNPLKYTDPSGEVFGIDDLIIAAVVGAVINVTMNGVNNSMSGQDFFDGAGKAAIVGGLAGAAGAGVAALGAGGALVGMVGGAFAGGTNAVLNNTNFGLGVAMGAFSGWVGGGISMYFGGGLGACLGGMTSNAIAQIPAIIKDGKSFNFSQMLLSGAFSWGAYFGSSYVNWKWRGGNKMGNLDVSFKQFNKMQTLFQRSRAWEKEMGGYLMEDGSFKTAEPGTNSQIDLGPRPDGAIAEFHTHWDKPGKTIYFDNDGNYVKNPPYWKSTVSRYHGALDFTEGIESIVFNRYDGSYFSGEYMLENLPGSFIGPPRWVPTPYQVINPPILRYNYGFLFSIRY